LMEIFLNGELFATWAFGPQNALDWGANILLGNRAGSGVTFDGSISNFSIWNRRLAINEIQTLNRDPLAPFRRRDLVIPYATPAAAATGRSMGSLAGAGGLAGPSGLAGTGGGIAG